MTDRGRCTCETPTRDEPFVGACNYCADFGRDDNLGLECACCDGIGVIGFPPDDFWPCPECTDPALQNPETPP